MRRWRLQSHPQQFNPRVPHPTNGASTQKVAVGANNVSKTVFHTARTSGWHCQEDSQEPVRCNLVPGRLALRVVGDLRAQFVGFCLQTARP